MGAYDILTGTQLCMAVAMIAYGFYFKKKRTCRVWYFSGPAWLIAIAWFHLSIKQRLAQFVRRHCELPPRVIASPDNQ